MGNQSLVAHEQCVESSRFVGSQAQEKTYQSFGPINKHLLTTGVIASMGVFFSASTRPCSPELRGRSNAFT